MYVESEGVRPPTEESRHSSMREGGGCVLSAVSAEESVKEAISSGIVRTCGCEMADHESCGL